MKLVKPFIDAPFLPQEVDKLSIVTKNKNNDIAMTSAILLGPPQKKEGLVEVIK